MADSNANVRLSQVQTLWTVVCKAHGDGSANTVRIAQEQLLERYGKVVYRYLVGALRDSEAADEVSQEFALRFVRGDLKRVDPGRGRFRDYLKGVLLHLIGDHYRRRKRALRSVSLEHDPPAAQEEVVFADREFLEGWRGELLNRAWKALAEHEEKTGQPFHSVLRLRAEKADLRSTALAVELSAKLNRPLTSDGVRQTLHRAREKFAEILLGEVAQTLVSPTLADLEQELIDVELHQYCAPALDKLRDSATS